VFRTCVRFVSGGVCPYHGDRAQKLDSPPIAVVYKADRRGRGPNSNEVANAAASHHASRRPDDLHADAFDVVIVSGRRHGVCAYVACELEQRQRFSPHDMGRRAGAAAPEHYLDGNSKSMSCVSL
jgi:hypothetical protein